MEIINLKPNTLKWEYHRTKYLNASDAPAMLGIHKTKSRDDLLRERYLGYSPDPDRFTQKLFDEGHEFERFARSLAEDILREDLFPVVGVSGEYSASFDGLSMSNEIIWEHKRLNNDIRSAETIDDLHPMYHAQMEHQLIVSGAEKCLFMASLWDENGALIEEKHFWYVPNLELRERIKKGWEQFSIDLQNYHLSEKTPQVKAEPVMNLPALSINMGGEISIRSNVEIFGKKLNDFIASTNANPETDQDFANLDAACKTLKDAETALKTAKDNALGQVLSVSELINTIDHLTNTARDSRLKFEKIVSTEKENRKASIISQAREAFFSHQRVLQDSLPVVLRIETPNFALAVKGKKTLSSIKESCDIMLTDAIISAGILFDQLKAKYDLYDAIAADHKFLFNDLDQIIYKQFDDFKNVLNVRIAEFNERERARKEDEEIARNDAKNKEFSYLLIESHKAENLSIDQRLQILEIDIGRGELTINSALHSAFEMGKVYAFNNEH
jgi:predicted phage-related endonuclease